MRKQSITLLAVLVTAIVALCGCASATPSPIVITQIVEVTSTTMPEPTETPKPIPVPLSDIDLEPLLIQPGDLPAGFRGAQVCDTISGYLERDAPAPDNFIWQQLERDAERAGRIAIIVYDDPELAKEAYDAIVDGFVEQKGTDRAGEAAVISAWRDLVGNNWTSSAFLRCHAVADFLFTDIRDAEAAKTYMQRLDARLEPVVCRD